MMIIKEITRTEIREFIWLKMTASGGYALRRECARLGILTVGDLIMLTESELRTLELEENIYNETVAAVNNFLLKNRVLDFTFPAPDDFFGDTAGDNAFVYERRDSKPKATESPLDTLPNLNLSAYVKLRHCGIRTIQELFGLKDAELCAIGGMSGSDFSEIVGKVNAFLKKHDIDDITFPSPEGAYDPLRDTEFKEPPGYDISREPLAYLGLHPSVYRALRNHGFNTVGQLLTVDPIDGCCELNEKRLVKIPVTFTIGDFYNKFFEKIRKHLS